MPLAAPQNPPCSLPDLFSCALHQAAGTIGGAAVNAVVPSTWDAICKSFADGAAQILGFFARSFTSVPTVDLNRVGIASTYGITVVIAGSVSALLILAQVIRTAWTHDGSGIAQAVSGTAKALLAWLMTAAVATAALAAADQVTASIDNVAFGSQQALAVRLASLVNWAGVSTSLGDATTKSSNVGQAVQAPLAGAIVLVLALVGIVLVIVLWLELLLRNAAIAVLVAVSPIAAAGQASEATKVWWQRLASATVQLIILKPVIAIVFAVGLGMAGTSSGLEQLLAGMLVLALAAFSWPVIARFFTFSTVQASSSGLAAVLGFAAGAVSARGGGESTAGVNPSQWSRAAEEQTMAAWGGAETAGPGTGGAGGVRAGAGVGGTTGGPGGGTAEGGAGGGGAAGAAAVLGFALRMAHRTGQAAAARMEQTAANAGMHGAYPYSTISGGSGGRGARPAATRQASAEAGPAAESAGGSGPGSAGPDPASYAPGEPGDPADEGGL